MHYLKIICFNFKAPVKHIRQFSLMTQYFIETKCNNKSLVQLNPAIAYFKGLLKILLYIEVLFIAKI